MNAGRELDEKIAREVMGWTKATLHDEVSGPEQYWCSGKTAHVLVDSWTPSIFIHYAWQVVEKLRSQGFNAGVQHPCVQHEGKAFVYFHAYTGGKIGEQFNAIADTAPLAICLAALKAVGVEVEE